MAEGKRPYSYGQLYYYEGEQQYYVQQLDRPSITWRAEAGMANTIVNRRCSSSSRRCNSRCRFGIRRRRPECSAADHIPGYVGTESVRIRFRIGQFS